MEKMTGKVLSQKELCPGIFDLRLYAPAIAEAASAGQFVNVFCREASRLLPRPLSLCRAEAAAGEIRLVYRAGGDGTREFSALSEGDALELLGPLGNGFPLEMAAGKRVLLIGGGIGIPPMLQTAVSLSDRVENRRPSEMTAVLGYRDQTFLSDEFGQIVKTYLATEDGSAGTKGTVLDAIRENNLDADLIFACGPKMMLRALKVYASERGIPCQVSLEERMACGIGACLACVCETAEVNGHTHVHNARVCKDGPVFDAEMVVL